MMDLRLVLTGIVSVALLTPAVASQTEDVLRTLKAMPSAHDRRVERMQERTEVTRLNAEVALLKSQMRLQEIETTKTTNKILKDSLGVLKGQVNALKDNYDYKGNSQETKALAARIVSSLDTINKNIDAYDAFLTKKPLGNASQYSKRLSELTERLLQDRLAYDKLVLQEMSEDWVEVEK